MHAPRPTRGYVDTAFGQIHYWTQRSSGPHIFFFHTSPLSGLDYGRVFPYLAGRWQGIASDNPGYA